MSISAEYHQLAHTLLDRYKIPDVASIHLPPLLSEELSQDCFGFIVLENAVAAPFYVSLEDTLRRLKKRLSSTKNRPYTLATMIDWLLADELDQRALAFGAFNAISQHLFVEWRYFESNYTDSTPAADKISVQGKLGMVGYFPSLVKRLLENGATIVMLEKNLSRIQPHERLLVAESAECLRECDRIICTASALINNSLSDLLSHKRSDAYFALIGPSGSGLPDVLFRHGIDAVGGVCIVETASLNAALSANRSLTDFAVKYQINSIGYPGFDTIATHLS